MKVTVSRKAHFNAAHRLFNNKWSQKKNDIVFGKCNNPNFHGHNYELIVSVTGEINTDTGYVIDMAFLKDIIKELSQDISLNQIKRDALNWMLTHYEIKCNAHL
jgi:6-pyruvoyltetrahydropterin/6-carboxytetrahydropterin synthase